MPRETRTGLMFDIGSVVTVAVDDSGWYGVRIGGYGGPESGLGDAELQCAYGFASRPVDRGSDGIGCDVLYAHAGNSETFAWFGRDARHIDKCPPLSQGSCASWNSAGAFHLLDVESNSSMLYVPRGSSAHTVTVGQASDGVDLIEFRHSSGALLYCTPSTGWVMRGVGNAFTTIDGDAFNVNGNATVTASLTVGGPAAMPVINATAFAAALTAAMAPFLPAQTPLATPATTGMLFTMLTALIAALAPGVGPANTKLFATL
jgi:hypothetical protein